MSATEELSLPHQVAECPIAAVWVQRTERVGPLSDASRCLSLCGVEVSRATHLLRFRARRSNPEAVRRRICDTNLSSHLTS